MSHECANHDWKASTNTGQESLELLRLRLDFTQRAFLRATEELEEKAQIIASYERALIRTECLLDQVVEKFK